MPWVTMGKAGTPVVPLQKVSAADQEELVYHDP